MEYIKAKALVEEYEAEDVIVTSSTCEDYANQVQDWDADRCDGVTQAVSKSQY